MGKKILIIIVALVLSQSCKKPSHETPVGTISATIDGIAESFNTNAVGQITTGVQSNFLLIGGSDGNSPEANTLSLSINSTATITKGSYSTVGTSSPVAHIFATVGHMSATQHNIYRTDVEGKYSGTIAITLISNTNVEGTFSGKLLLDNGTTIKIITDGKFNVSLK